MRRKTRFVAVFAAFFVLQGPLCALACLDVVTPAAASMGGADASPASAAGHGCHDIESSTPSSPSSPLPPSSRTNHDDCGCDGAAPALVSSSVDAAAKLLTVAVALPAHKEFPPALRRLDRATPVAAATDLPPPDLLLLHSILLI